MLCTARSRAAFLLSRRAQVSARRAYAFSANDTQELNTTEEPKKVTNVSKSNETQLDDPSVGTLAETVEHAEKLRATQAPNRVGIWSRSQNPREKAMTGPRFEQTIMELQVREGQLLLWQLIGSKMDKMDTDGLTAKASSCH
jgi:NADH dehydrogenase (ubiquinone) Fe-S protein 6